MKFEDTICAPATPVGGGAVSIVRVSGPDALGVADRVVTLRRGTVSEAGGYSLHLGEVKDEDRVLDEVIVSVFRAPHSYTGEDGVEIACHASPYIVSRLMELLIGAGARAAGPGEFTRRAFVNGRMDLAQAEAVADVIRAESATAHRVAMNQLRGGFSGELKTMRSELVRLTSLLELELDFDEQDVEFADRSQLLDLVEQIKARIDSLCDSFRLGNAIRRGIPVAIVGAVNAGKSTLLNALLGDDRAIVSDVPGTTRDTVEETLNLGGTLFRFIDTAGLRETSESVERQGIERTWRKLSEADVVLGVVDATLDYPSIEASLREILGRVQLSEQKVLILANKLDVNEGNKNVQSINSFVSSIDCQIVVIKMAAKTGLGLSELRNALSDYAAHRLAGSDTTLVTNARHYEALLRASLSLDAVHAGLNYGRPSDLVAQDLREALHHLGTITGDITTDEILGEIFQHFCIGK